MGDSLRSLTLRGKGFLVAGLTALAAGLILGQRALTFAAIIGMTLPVLTAWLLGRSQFRIALHRSVSPPLIKCGQSAMVSLDLGNTVKAGYGTLFLEEQLPYALGSRPRFVLNAGQREPVTYSVVSDVRGRFELGPLKVDTLEPLGLAATSRAFRGTDTLWVAPATIALQGKPPHALAHARGEEQLHAFATGSPEDVTVREYRQGDDLRRIHWPSSAKTGDLMVRNEEQPWQAEAAVLVDTRTSALASDFETGLSIAGSLVEHFLSLSYVVRLHTSAAVHDIESTITALQTLAEEAPSASSDLVVWPRDHVAGLVIAVFGPLDEADLIQTRLWRQNAATAWAVCLDAATGEDLALQGWKAVVVTTLGQLADGWAELIAP